ncbi:MAG: hypothetical protein EHM63_08030 [Actinobacteria bacterium]|jgi:hypothetical protein|nr:MAG: hypothetical protein EHM63_08030 [Actinomycetota bacterium]
MASVVITVTRSGHETIVTEESADDYGLRSADGKETVIETPTADMVFAHAVARVCRAEKFDITRMAERLLALSREKPT